MDFSGEMADEIFKIFQVESEEIISRINNNLLELEKKPNDKDVILLLFRDAHTLKGASRMVGFTSVQTLAHKMEDVLGLAKEDKIRFNSDVINVLYQTVDFLAEVIQKSIEKGKEIYSEKVQSHIVSLDNIENDTVSLQVSDNSEDEFNSELLINNSILINQLMVSALASLMMFEAKPQDASIETLGTLITKLFEIFKAINHFEIKKTLEDVKVKLDFILRASGELTGSEVDGIQQVLDGVIEKLIPIFEIYNVEIVDYYSMAFDALSSGEISLPDVDFVQISQVPQKSQKTLDETILKEPEVEPVLSTQPEDFIQIQKIEDDSIDSSFAANEEEAPDQKISLKSIINAVLNLAQGQSSILQVQNMVANLKAECSNSDVKIIAGKIGCILDFARDNELNLSEEAVSVINESLEHCERLLDNTADLSNNDLYLQRLTIVLQVLEIGVSKDDKPTVKSSFKVKTKPSDFLSAYNTGEIKTLRVDSTRLDSLINQVNELTVTKIKTKKHVKELDSIAKELQDWQKSATKIVNYLKYYDKKYFQSVSDIQHSQSSTNSFFIKQLLNLFNENNKKATDTVANVSSLQRTIQEDDAKMGVIIDNLGSMVKDVRVLPLATVFHLFGRMVRDIAQEKGKKIDFEIQGSETSTDKKIIEEIKTPLIHIIRNAIDHGIESPEQRIASGKKEAGKILLSAMQKGNKVIIEIKDDGRGINIDKIKEKAIQKGFLTSEETAAMSDEQLTNLIFAPGFSTGDEITNISGRGIGLDVVQSKISQLNGKVKVISQTNVGCCVRIELPTTMSTINAFLVNVSGHTYAIPMENINTVLRKNCDEIIKDKHKKSIIFDEKTIQLYDLADILKLKKYPNLAGKEIILILEVDNKILAISVDKLIGDQEILHKKLSAPLFKVKNISGVTTLASGETCLILNISDLFKTADVLRKHPAVALEKKVLPNSAYRILLVDDSITTRTLEKNILVKAGYNIEIAQNPKEAFLLMSEVKFDLIISDVEMPEMDGFEFLQRIKTDEKYSEIPVIMVSSLISDEYKNKASQLGAAKYIVKGEFEQDSFQNSIGEILRR